MRDHNCADRTCVFCRTTTRRTATGATPAQAWPTLSTAASREVASWSRVEQIKTNLSGTELEELEMLALVDKETGLYNSRALLRELAQEMAQARRRCSYVSVCMISFNVPRQLLQQFGPELKATTLRASAQVVRSCIRETDSAGRSAGNELAVILPDCTAQNATGFAVRLKKALDEELRNKQRLWGVGVHIAVGCFPGNAKQKDELLEKMRSAIERAFVENREIVRIA